MGNLLPVVEFAIHLVNHHHHHHRRISVTILTISMPQWPLIDHYVRSHTPTDHIRLIQLPPADTPSPDQYTSRIEFISLYIQNHRPMVQQTLATIEPLVGLFVDMFCTSMIDQPCPSLSPVDSLNELTVASFTNPVPSSAFPLFCRNKNELGYSCFVRHAVRYKETKGIVVNTFRELEPYSLDSLSSDYIGLPPVYPVGPVVDHVGPVKWHPNRSGLEKVIQWLDRQPDCSVVFLCFGSMGSLNRAQTKVELPNDYEELEKDLFPDGFVDRTAQSGLVCGWVSQVSVLAHKAIGGFVSHCGWNSILESISYGVPVATWPLYGEQHLNAFEMVKELGLSVEMKLDKGNDLVLADEVERGVRELMDGRDGALKIKVKEMSDKSKVALMKNGSSFQALENLLDVLLF
ncbi:hypothetical protein R6Q59_007716 [Mikania micrantha]